MTNRYSIKDLENFSGVKAHTIRIWEKRYNLLSPKRTETNIRFYTDSDLKKILNIATLNGSGCKISEIAKMSETELNQNTHETIQKVKSSPGEHTDFIEAILQVDRSRLMRLFSQELESRNMLRFYDEVIKSLLVKVGTLWHAGSVSIAQEHFFSHVLKEFLLGKTFALGTEQNGRKALLFLPEGESHELTILFINYILKERNWDCTYLGTNVPLLDFEKTFEFLKPDLVVSSSVMGTTEKQFDKLINQIANISNGAKLCMVGYNVVNYDHLVPDKVHTISSTGDIEKILSN